MRSRYRDQRGGIERRGFESKDQPARTADEPVDGQSEYDECWFAQKELVHLTIIDYDGSITTAVAPTLVVDGLEATEWRLSNGPDFRGGRLGRVASR